MLKFPKKEDRKKEKETRGRGKEGKERKGGRKERGKKGERREKVKGIEWGGILAKKTKVYKNK